MKKILYILTGFLVCSPASAQLPSKIVTGAVTSLEKNASKVLPSATRTAGGLRYAPGFSVSASSQLAPYSAAHSFQPGVSVRLEKAVSEQVSLRGGLKESADFVRRTVAGGTNPSAALKALFGVPVREGRTALLQNEFLTLTLQQGAIPSAEQSAEALKVFRADLIHKKEVFSSFKDVSSIQSVARGDAKKIDQAALALADMAGIGFYGEAKDSELILSVYQSSSQTVLEPLVFNVAARALLSLKAYGALEELMRQGKPSAAWDGIAQVIQEEGLPVQLVRQHSSSAISQDWHLLKKPFSRVCCLNEKQLDFSAQATKDWLKMPLAKEQAAPVQAEVVLEKEIPVYVTPSLQSEALPGISSPAAEETVVPAAEKKVAEKGRSSYEFFAPSNQTEEGVLYSGFPVFGFMGKVKNLFSHSKPQPEAVSPATDEYNPVVPVLTRAPRVSLVNNKYPSGLEDEESIIRDWLEYFKNGYFRPRDQVEAIEGMSAAKANNVMEYLYYMSLEEAEKVILNPIRETGRLPDFMYDDRLITGTKRLPAGYYKNKFNENVKRFVELAEEDGSIYTHNVELKDLATSMADYSFKQGFRYMNDPQMTAGLRHNWKELVGEIRNRGLRADRNLINNLWRRPVQLDNGKSVSLKDYFTQTRPTAFFKEGRMPEFFLNSNKWVSWENERRNLAAAEYINQSAPAHLSWFEKLQNWFVLGKSSSYLTLEQFGNIMTSQYEKSYGAAVRTSEQEYMQGISPAVLEDATPSSMTVKINNFDKIGGVCQMSFSEGGYMGKVREGYDGTSTVSRFDLNRFFKVPVVTFDVGTLKPQIVTLKSVPYLKDLKEPDLDQVRAGTMVGDGLDPTRDLLGVQEAEKALVKIPHLKATLYPRARLDGYEKEKPEYLDGGGLAGYLTLFTPDFYPIKKVYRLRFKGLKPYIETQYFIRREVPALAGLIHRDRLTFTEQVQDRIVEDKKPSPEEQTPAK